MIILDAGLVIAHLNPADIFHTAVVEFLESHATSRFAMSTLTLAECLVRPTQAGVADAVLTALDVLDVEIIPIEAGDARALAAVRASAELRMPDAVVLFTAEQLSAELATTDAALARAAKARGRATHEIRPA